MKKEYVVYKLSECAKQACRIDNELWVNVPAEVNNGVAVIVEQYLYNIFANIVNIALDRSKDNFALADGRTACL